VVLIGEVLLQRTRGDLVEPVFRDFIRRWPDAVRLGRAREPTIARVIRPLGLAKRAPIIKRLGTELARRGALPTTPEELLELPGIGPYAAHAVPVFALGMHYPVVDWVIARVLRRYFGLPGDSRPNQDRELWDRARRLIRTAPAREVWLGLLDFASAVCKPNPVCPTCPLRTSCVEGRRRLHVNRVDRSRKPRTRGK
jgi:A/G-specific adenine glycosylase